MLYNSSISVRKYLRRGGHFQIDAEPREQGYLKEFPFLMQFIPLGRPVERGGIRVKRFDVKAVAEQLFHDVHLVKADGEIIATASKDTFCTEVMYTMDVLSPWSSPIIQNLGSVMERLLRTAWSVLDQTKLVVTTGSFWKTVPCLFFSATIYKLSRSKKETPSNYITRTLAGYHEAEKQAAEKVAHEGQKIVLTAQREVRRLKRS